MRPISFVFLLVLILAISSCSDIDNDYDKTYYEDGSLNVYFCPKEDCKGVFIDSISSAKNELKCALYDLGDEEIMGVLDFLSENINVSVVMDGDYVHKFTRDFVRFDDSGQLSHNKFCIVDSLRVITGSTNPTKRGLSKNNNNMVVVDSKIISSLYLSEFSELWNGVFGSGKKTDENKLMLNGSLISVYFCPEDDCDGRLAELLMDAKESVHFMTFSFTDSRIGNILAYRSDELDISGIFEKTQASSKYSQYSRLKGFSLNVTLDNNSYNMHNKVFIIDSETVVTGSYNPTESGSSRNDENLVIIRSSDIASRYLSEFYSLFA